MLPVGVSLPSHRYRPALLLVACVLLAACGGAGGGRPVSVSAAAPAPAPLPTTTNYDTPEYRRTGSATAANVLTAWQAGASGAGVTIGFVDSGIASSNPEFAGRILSASRDVTGLGRGIVDLSGHGTAVAGIATAARNEFGIVGIAPSASLAVMRADNGDCVDGCRYADSAIAAGIDAAVAAGARVVNISLGGSNASGALRSSFVRATSAGTVLVISAGNEADGEVDPLAAGALSATARNNVIVVGAVDENGVIADFSNRAGSSSANYIAARGVSVRSFDKDGVAYLYGGTSFAAPAVAGAVALLAQSFPNLSGSQIVELILNNATDAGVPGVDGVYGRGVLNIGRAMAPSGQTSLAGTGIAVPLAGTGTLGSAMGDGLAAGSGLAAVPVTDSYARAYTVALGPTLRPASAGRLAGRLNGASLATAETQLTAGRFEARLELRATGPADRPGSDRFRDEDGRTAHLGLAQRGVDAGAGNRTPLRETRLRLSAGPLGLTAASGRLASESLPGGVRGGFVADDGLSPDEGTGTEGRQMVMAEARRGALSLALAATSSRTRLAPTSGLGRTARQDRLTLAIGYACGPLTLAAHVADVHDNGALLGTRLAPAFGLLGGRSRQIGGSAGLEHGGFGVRLAATGGRHTPHLSATGLLRGNGALVSRSWSATASAPLGDGLLTLRLAQPLAVTGGSLRLANGAVLHAAATAHETATEVGFDRGPLSVALFRRRDAGNIPGLQDNGGALAFRSQF